MTLKNKVSDRRSHKSDAAEEKREHGEIDCCVRHAIITAPTAMPAFVDMSWMPYAEPVFAMERRCRDGCKCAC